jgi:hypothetical protein
VKELPDIWKLFHELSLHGRERDVWSGHRAEPYWRG